MIRRYGFGHLYCLGWAHSLLSQNTNVVKFFSLLRKDDVDNQLVYYQVSALRLPYRSHLTIWVYNQAGIGTYFTPGIVSPFFEWAAQILDEAVAWFVHTSASYVVGSTH
jgi:hypothetical protein